MRIHPFLAASLLVFNSSVSFAAPSGLEFFQRISGLWSGPATGTPLGNFPLMNVDFRAASDHVLFGRVDLSSGNALRFAFSIETFDGEDVLVYRNGGYFQGTLRDMRTKLVESDAIAGSYRFCSVDRGCDYIEAKYQFTNDDHLNLDVSVQRTRHLVWQAVRKETRVLPQPFPIDLVSQGTGTAPFPPMPSLRVKVNWSVPLLRDADVWIMLSSSDCSMAGGGCTTSRSFMVNASAGSTSAEALLDQIHPGSYKANVILDRNRNFRTTLYPDSGDGVGLPNQATDIVTSGVSSSNLSIVWTLP